MRHVVVMIIASGALAAAPPAHVLTGIDVLASQNFAPLRGKNVGLITNQTGLTYDVKRDVDVMLAGGVKVKKLFAPEHGFLGLEDQLNLKDDQDAATGLPIVSLYKTESSRITPDMLKGLDALVYDIQDVGARFYTYSCTMIASMEEAAKAHVPYYLLDRPNPITGTRVEGPMLDEGLHSFVGCIAEPIRHGMTFGELASMVNGERHLGADLHVVRMQGWRRKMWFDDTDQTWVNPSPNIRSLNAATIYTGIAMLEYSTNYSVGRGSDAPFEQVGADWITGRDLAAYLNARRIPGIHVYATRFRPTESHLKGKIVEGVRFVITDREAVNAIRLGIEVACALNHLYPGKIKYDVNARLIGNKAVIEALTAGKDPETIEQIYRAGLQNFLGVRQKYLLYE